MIEVPGTEESWPERYDRSGAAYLLIQSGNNNSLGPIVYLPQNMRHGLTNS